MPPEGMDVLVKNAKGDYFAVQWFNGGWHLSDGLDASVSSKVRYSDTEADIFMVNKPTHWMEIDGLEYMELCKAPFVKLCANPVWLELIKKAFQTGDQWKIGSAIDKWKS